jgi:hypothetical protein
MLFELVCLVRVLRTVAPNPTAIRWLVPDAGINNAIALDGVRCRYQHRFETEHVLATSEYDNALRAAVTRHQLAVHTNLDLLVELSPPRAGFHGIILEAKSGQQSYAAAVAQLKHYRAAIRRERGGRWLVWGVCELEEPLSATEAALKAVMPELQGTDDVWFFSPASAIPMVLRCLGIAA